MISLPRYMVFERIGMLSLEGYGNFDIYVTFVRWLLP